MSQSDLSLFAPAASAEYGHRVAAALDSRLTAHEERAFEDGEHKSRPLESVRGRDVYVIQALYGDAEQSVNDKLLHLLFLLGTLRDAQTERVTAVIPYLAYARKDRRTKPHDPVTTRYLAELIESMGVDRVVAVDVHNPAAFENAFRVPTVHLEARPLFARALTDAMTDGELAIVSPDTGGYKRAEHLRETLAERTAITPSMAFLEKKRSEGIVSGDAMVGDVAGKTAIIVDDLVSTGGTIARAAAACQQGGAQRVYAVATHGLFTGDASRVLAEASLERLLIADTVPPFRLSPALRQARLDVVDTTPLVAGAIRCMHENHSVVDMMEAW
ncbi:ribose-phosphate diphosphokinase [Arhodomonas sp. AD133]|uniref:ribose-phosphate diphosphokinase n=1 Tax=Arhodomonas sp. AD133 TaxID=3415009 RepID=UPI003EB98687